MTGNYRMVLGEGRVWREVSCDDVVSLSVMLHPDQRSAIPLPIPPLAGSNIFL